jgi:hypothetical protein
VTQYLSENASAPMNKTAAKAKSKLRPLSEEEVV